MMNNRLGGAARRLDGLTTRFRVLLGLVLAALLSVGLAAYNVNAGPLSNLNDIGGWANRLIMIVLTACVQMLVLSGAVLIHRGSFARLALREWILTAGMLILLLGINQKTFVYVNTVQPIVRLMDEQGLSALAGAQTNLSAPALTLLYVITRGPIYDMYLVKLFCMASFMGLALLSIHLADRKGWGIRAEVLLALVMILPHAFLSVGCAAQIELFSALLLGLSLTLLAEKKNPLAAWLLYGAAAAICGAALYALPLMFLAAGKGGTKPLHVGAAAVLMGVLCVPAMLAGMPMGEALKSLLRANLALPEYAAGVPNIMSLIPRAPVEEMPAYFLLRHVPSVDKVTNFPEFYTVGHYALMMHGFTLAGLAGFAALCALVLKNKAYSALRTAFVLALGAMLVCPGAGAGFWLGLAVLCIAVILAEPELRIPACMVLFATAGGLAYPVTEEILLPQPAGLGLCVLAFLMLLGVVPGAAFGKENQDD